MCLTCIYNWWSLGFNSATIPFYTAVITFMIKQRHKEPFDSAFFKFFISLGVADILCNVGFTAGHKLPLGGWFRDTYLGLGGGTAKFLNVWILYMTLNQGFHLAIIGANRFWASTHRFSLDTVWTTKRSLMIISATWILCCVPFIPVIAYAEFEVKAYYNKTDVSSESVFIHWSHNSDAFKFLTFMFVCGSFDMLVIFFCYLMTMIEVYKEYQGMSTISLQQDQNESAQVQFRLAMYGCATSLPMFMALCSYFLPFADSTRSIIYNFTLDLFCGLNPWLLLLFSRQTRIEFFVFLPTWAKKLFIIR